MLELATSADFQAVNAMAVQLHELHVAWRPDIFTRMEQPYSRERFDGAIANRALYVAKVNGQTVGYAAVKRITVEHPGMAPRKALKLEELCVEEACRGCGIGTEILTDIKALARAFGCTDLEIGAYPQNEAGLRLYRKAGLTVRSVQLQMKL